MAKRIIFLKSYNNFDLFGVYKDNKFLYKYIDIDFREV